MTKSEELAVKIQDHLRKGGRVLFATCYSAMILNRRHVDLVQGSTREGDRGVYLKTRKSRTFWMEYCITFQE